MFLIEDGVGGLILRFSGMEEACPLHCERRWLVVFAQHADKGSRSRWDDERISRAEDRSRHLV